MDLIISTIFCYIVLKILASLYGWASRVYEFIHQKSPFWANLVENILIAVTSFTYIHQIISGIYGSWTGEFIWFVWASWISFVYPQWAMTAVCVEILRRRYLYQRRKS